jgi:hypothetical protein
VSQVKCVVVGNVHSRLLKKPRRAIFYPCNKCDLGKYPHHRQQYIDVSGTGTTGALQEVHHTQCHMGQMHSGNVHLRLVQETSQSDISLFMGQARLKQVSQPGAHIDVSVPDT